MFRYTYIACLVRQQLHTGRRIETEVMLLLTKLRYLNWLMTGIMKSFGLLDWSNHEASKFFLEFKLVLHITKKKERKKAVHLTFAGENCALRGRHYKYSYSCKVAASHFIRSDVWFWDVTLKNDEDGETKEKMWKWRSESHMAANLELHVATSAARYPQARNYLSILTTKLKSRGTKERERQSGVETREKRCWIQCYKTK